MKNLFSLSAFLLCAVPLAATAQTAREQLLAQEKDYATKTAQGNVVTPFQPFLTSATLNLEAGQTQAALAMWRSRPLTPTAQFNRYPELADVAQSGDLGYTLGPWTITDKNRTVSAGEFVTLWRKQPDGKWKVAVSTTVDHARTTAEPPANVLYPRQLVGPPTPIEVPVEIILELDKKFAAAELHAPLKTYEQYLSAETRLYRPGQLPLVAATAHQIIENDTRAYLFVPSKGAISAAGDLGYVYGSLRRPSVDVKQPDEVGTYLRVWRREAAGGWRIVVEVLNTAPQAEVIATASN